MILTPHFTVEEFTRSDYALRHGLDNTLPATMLMTAKETCELLERIRTALSSLAGRDIPIRISSGYRSPDVNAGVGSNNQTSDHPRALAADFEAPSFGTPYEICRVLGPRVSELGIGQLINEFPPQGWVHVSTRRPDKEINRIVTINSHGTRVGIQEA